MSFGELMGKLFKTHEQFPTMHWETSPDGFLNIRVFIGTQNVNDLEDARRMFEPASD